MLLLCKACLKEREEEARRPQGKASWEETRPGDSPCHAPPHPAGKRLCYVPIAPCHSDLFTISLPHRTVVLRAGAVPGMCSTLSPEPSPEQVLSKHCECVGKRSQAQELCTDDVEWTQGYHILHQKLLTSRRQQTQSRYSSRSLKCLTIIHVYFFRSIILGLGNYIQFISCYSLHFRV